MSANLNPFKKSDVVVAIISPFTLFSGHHFNYTLELAEQLAAAGVITQIHTVAGGERLRRTVPSAAVYEICPWLKAVHAFFNLDSRRGSWIFTLIQNFETFVCIASFLRHRKSVTAVYWQDARHQIMLWSILALPPLRHANLVLGPVPFGGVGTMKPRIFGLYQRVLKSRNLTFICETEAIVESWRSLAGSNVVEIPVALGEPPENSPPLTRHDLGIPEDAFVCLLFGTHRADKDYETVLNAASLVKSKIHLLFVGPVISSNDPAVLIARHKCLQATVVNKFVTEREASGYFLVSNCAILPYPKTYNKGSAVLLQAAKYNIPVIASGAGHLERFLDTHRSGLCYIPGDKINLAQVIDRMAQMYSDNPASWDQALHAVRSNFSWGKIIQEYLSVFGIQNRLSVRGKLA